MKTTLWMLAVAGALAIACTGSDGSGSPASAAPPTIEISGGVYSPSSITVDAGTRITVKNLDTDPHSVTSEANTGDFSPGEVAGVAFDTGEFDGGVTVTLTIPGSAPSGTVIPYFCTVHGNMMGQGTITVH